MLHGWMGGMSEQAIYRRTVMVKKYDIYGERIVASTPTTILAKDQAEVTAKVREAFNAKYDDFRKFWSHGWTLTSVDEVSA
jgi:hypothetical protein